jgi:AcrR family transcriptional regulator
MYLEGVPRGILRGVARASTVGSHGRRTQAERRETTRTALLDAAIECLVEYGYAGTTTRRIAQRAGVSPGALQHHFASKAELLGESVGHLRARWAQEIFAEAAAAQSASVRERHERLLDRMWGMYRGPLFKALLEIAIGARTDSALANTIVGSHEEMNELNAAGIPLLFPEHADRPQLGALVATGQAAMRGLALVGLTGDGDPDALWPHTREHILALNALVLDDDALR